MLKINTQAPSLKVETLDSKTYSLKESTPNTFSLIVFYRGLHCPVCKDYLEDLNKIFDDYKELGVDDIVCVSGDSEKKAKKTQEEWDIGKLNVGYNLSIDSMKEWKLYISDAIKDSEPKVFNEPGVFLVNKDKTLYYAAYNSMPFARPDLKALMKSIKFIKENDYPARGTHA